MTPDQFTYWLQGFAEVNGAAPTREQWQIICDHLALVFKKETPKREKSELEKWLEQDAAKRSATPAPNWGGIPPSLGYPLKVTC